MSYSISLAIKEMPKECPFCHDIPIVAKDPLWNEGHGYYGNYGAGGGGSSYTHPTLCTGVTHTQGFTAADAGYIILTPMD